MFIYIKGNVMSGKSGSYSFTPCSEIVKFEDISDITSVMESPTEDGFVFSIATGRKKPERLYSKSYRTREDAKKAQFAFLLTLNALEMYYDTVIRAANPTGVRVQVSVPQVGEEECKSLTIDMGHVINMIEI